MTDMVTPHTENDMVQLRQVFDKALNAIVNATQLASEVAELRNSVNELRGQVDHYRTTIANQDDQITRLRQERDAATADAANWTVKHSQLTAQHNEVLQQVDHLQQELNGYRDQVSRLTAERDDALKRASMAEAEAAKHKDKVKSVEDFLRQTFAKAPEPEATQAPVQTESVKDEPVLVDPWWPERKSM